MPLLIVAALGSAWFAAAAIRGLTFLGPTTKAEGNQLNSIMRLRAGDPVYVNFFTEPFLLNPYPPILYTLNALISGALALDVYQTAIAARAVSLLAVLVSVGIVFLLSRAIGASRLASIATAGSILVFPFLDGWAFTIRADGLAIMLSLLSALALVRAPDRIWVAVIFAVLAFFTKQTMVALPAAAVLWFWLAGRRHAAVQFVGLWVALVVPVLLGLHIGTQGAYALNAIISHLSPTNGFDAAAAAFIQLSQKAWLPLVLAIGWVGAGLFRRRLPSLIEWYWLISLAITLYTLRGRGSAENYFIEPGMLSCVLAAPALDAIRRRLNQDLRSGFVAASLLTGAVIAWGLPNLNYWARGGEGANPAPGMLPEVAVAERVLAEEPTMVVLAGKPLLASDPFPLSQMVSGNRYDESEMVRLVQSQSYDLIIVRGNARENRAINGQPKWPPRVLRAVAANYVVQRTRGPYWLYVPDRPR